jgi:Cu(I)/Ag(I) efflux system membrane fusion protein
MANDNKGATWISKDKNIINPYFGDKMLTCGSVESVIGQ